MLSADPDLGYRIDVSTDMKNWHYNGDGLGDPYFEVQITDNGNGTRSILAHLLEPVSAGRAFVRVVFLY